MLNTLINSELDILNQWLMSILGDSIPDNTMKEFEKDGVKLKFEKKDGTVKINLETSNFDDSEIKEQIKNYKEIIEDFDDNLFVKMSEELGTKINLNHFNNLLELETFNEEQVKEVKDMLDVAGEVACQTIQHEIQKLVELYERF